MTTRIFLDNEPDAISMLEDRLNENCIEGKNIIITGGTGSFGNYILPELLKMNARKITVFSRDEDKQHHMRLKYQRINNLSFVVGDVRDYNRILEISKNADIILHAAALKQVPYCEEYPYESVLTNIIGAKNIMMAAIANNVDKVLAISTDKAVKPVNAMGMTKALQEKIFTAIPIDGTKFACVRYGNVIGSRGSVVLLFQEKIRLGEPLPITDENMTRFLLTLKNAVDLVLLALRSMKGGEVFVRKCPSCRIVHLGKVMYKLLNPEKFKEHFYCVTGIRPGEKLHEVLVSEDEARTRTEENGRYYTIYPYWQSVHFGINSEYSSNPPTITDDEELVNILMSADNLKWDKNNS